MSELSKQPASNRSGLTLSMILLLFNLMAVIAVLGMAGLFAGHYQKASGLPATRNFAAPGTISTRMPAASKQFLLLSKRERDAIEEWTGDIPEVAKLFGREDDLVGNRESESSASEIGERMWRYHFETLSSNQIPVSEKVIRGNILAAMQPSPEMQTAARGSMTLLLSTKSGLPPSLIANLADVWVAKTDYQTMQLLRRQATKVASQELPNFLNGSGLKLDLTPAIRQPSPRQSTTTASNVSTPTTIEISNERTVATAISTFGQSADRSAEPVDLVPSIDIDECVAALSNPSTARQYWGEIAKLPKTDPLLDELVELSKRTIASEMEVQTPALEAIPKWIDRLAIMLNQSERSEPLLTIKNFLSRSPAVRVSDAEVRRVLELALSQRSPDWIQIILKWLPATPIDQSTDYHQRLFTEEAWPTSTASVIHFLMGDDTGAMANWVSQKSLAGAIARQVLLRCRTWDQSVVTALVATASEMPANSDYTFRWLSYSNVGTSTRSLFDQTIAEFDEESKRIVVLGHLIDVSDVFADPATGERLFVEYHRRGELWGLLARIFSSKPNWDWQRVDAAIETAIDQHGPIFIADSPELAKRVDAQLAAGMLRRRSKSAESLFSLTELFGGRISLGMLRYALGHPDDYPELEMAQVQRVVDVISERLTDVGVSR